MSTSTGSSALAKSGIAGLDVILGGGFPRDHVYLVEGETGTGKTTLGLQFALEGVKIGEPVLYLTLSETRAELENFAASHGWSMDGMNVYELAVAEEEWNPDEQYTLFHPSEVELDDTLKQVVAEVMRVQPTRLVLDTLSALRFLTADPIGHRRQIQMMRQYLTRHHCTVLLLEEQGAQSDNFQPHSLAHGVIRLERRSMGYGSDRRYLQAVKLRGVPVSTGWFDIKIVRGGMILFPRLVAAQHSREITGGPISSGIPEFDALLGGGLDRGTSTLFMGPAGAGKSTVATQFAASAAGCGERSAIYIFDEACSTFLMRARGLGIPVEEHIDGGRIRIQKVDPAEMSPGEFAHLIRQDVERDGVSLVTIDSLSGYLHAMPNEQYLDLHFHELLSYLGNQGVVTLLVMVQHGLIGSSMATPVDLSYLADTVVLMRYFEAMGQLRQAVSVVKKRSGIHERSVREFRLGPTGLRVAEPLKDFEGVLTGIPRYKIGKDEFLSDEDR